MKTTPSEGNTVDRDDASNPYETPLPAAPRVAQKHPFAGRDVSNVSSYRRAWLFCGHKILQSLRAGATADDVNRWLHGDLLDWALDKPDDPPPRIEIRRDEPDDRD